MLLCEAILPGTPARKGGAACPGLPPHRFRSCQSHWPLPPTFPAERSPQKDKTPAEAHVAREKSALARINVLGVRASPGAADRLGGLT
jgi:hypothetical protein